MTSSADLPPELWLIIFDHFTGSRLGSLTTFNHITFPDIINQIRDPRNYPTTGRSAMATLRLVCRAFNSLLGPSTKVFVTVPDTSDSNDMPGIFNCHCGERGVSFQRLLADPSRSHHIVTLDLPGCEYYCSPVPVLFSILCDNSDALPNVRSLALGLHRQTVKCKEPPVLRFWGNLNAAFPRLVCLVLRGKLKFFSPNPWGRVVFQHLEILDADMVFVDSSVYFPMLRHAALGAISLYSVPQFNGWSLLESLIIRQAYGWPLDWDQVPRLQFLGLPSSDIRDVSHLPTQHPLRHVYFYMVPSRERTGGWIQWLKESARDSTRSLLNRGSNLERITLVYPPLSGTELVSIDVDEEGIVGFGLSREVSSTGCREGECRVVFCSPT